jgi:hypothetical protein
MTEQTQTRFEVNMHHRYDLRTWLRNNFNFVEDGGRYNGYSPQQLEVLEKRAGEVTQACTQVAEIDRRNNSTYVAYYAEDWQKINDAIQKRDFQQLGSALNDLLGAIDVE